MSQTRRLAAILAADVAGYSRLMGTDEEGTLERLKALRRELLDPRIAEHRGRIVKTTGDGLLVEFASVVDAVRCAVAVQQAMPERDTGVAAEGRIELRIGINLGDVIVEGDDLYGDGVNIAARIEALADAGGVFVSNTVHDQVRDRLPFVFEDLGEQQVKNIARPVWVYRVRPQSPHPSPPPRAREGSALGARVGAAEPPALALPDKPSIAVLPFANMSGDPEQEYFADGMVEEIITALSRIRWLFVIARSSTFTYKGQAIDVKQVGRELGVRYVLEGSVRKGGSRVRITAQLIDAETGAPLWADRFDGSLEDVFDLQDKVASSVAGVIGPTLQTAEIRRSSGRPTSDLTAYDLYLRALALHYKFDEGSEREAVALLRRALSISPGYAPAAALVGRCRIGQGAQGWGPVSAEEILEAVTLARQAIETAQNDSGILAEAGFTLSALAGDHGDASAAIDRALILNANSADAWTYRGWVACYRNDPGRAIDAFDRAMRLSPLDPRAWHFAAGRGLAHMIAGEYQNAVEWADRSLSVLPRFGPTLRTKIVGCVQQGRIAEARAVLARMNRLQPNWTIASFKAATEKIFPPEVLAVYVDGLRKAGMPEE